MLGCPMLSHVKSSTATFAAVACSHNASSFEVFADACAVGTGAVLLQDGRPVVFAKASLFMLAGCANSCKLPRDTGHDRVQAFLSTSEAAYKMCKGC